MSALWPLGWPCLLLAALLDIAHTAFTGHRVLARLPSAAAHQWLCLVRAPYGGSLCGAWVSAWLVSPRLGHSILQNLGGGSRAPMPPAFCSPVEMGPGGHRMPLMFTACALWGMAPESEEQALMLWACEERDTLGSLKCLGVILPWSWDTSPAFYLGGELPHRRE